MICRIPGSNTRRPIIRTTMAIPAQKVASNTLLVAEINLEIDGIAANISVPREFFEHTEPFDGTNLFIY